MSSSSPKDIDPKTKIFSLILLPSAQDLVLHFLNNEHLLLLLTVNNLIVERLFFVKDVKLIGAANYTLTNYSLRAPLL